MTKTNTRGGTATTKTKTKTKPVVKYHYYKNKKTGIRRGYKRTLLLTLEGEIAKTLSNRDIQLYWTYDTKKNKLEIYEDQMLD